MIQLLSNKHMGPLIGVGDNYNRFQNSNKVYLQDAFKPIQQMKASMRGINA
jgi:hypothetical protein